MQEFLLSDACISDCEKYRYQLRRIWNSALPTLPICMLNPSIADVYSSDATLNRIIYFADQWGYGGVHVVNLYAWRSPKPAQMFQEPFRVGPDNERYLLDAMEIAKGNGGKFWIGWGDDGEWEGEADKFRQIASTAQVELICCGTNNSGSPKHPKPIGKQIADDQLPLLWTAKIDNGRERSYRCTKAERDALDMIRAWPGVPAIVTMLANGNISVSTAPEKITAYLASQAFSTFQLDIPV